MATAAAACTVCLDTRRGYEHDGHVMKRAFQGAGELPISLDKAGMPGKENAHVEARSLGIKVETNVTM